MEEKVFKSFAIVQKTSSKSGKKYSALRVTSQYDKEADLLLSESQKEIIDEVGLKNCSVDIVTRHSEEKDKDYDVICLYVGEDISFDFFPFDRAYIQLAKMHLKRYLRENATEQNNA